MTGGVPSHLRSRFAYLDSLDPSGVLPDPWREVGVIHVGGLWHIGFPDHSDLMLIISVSGRGVVDCATGTKIARDDQEYFPALGSLEAEGIGALENQPIRIAGIQGGALSRFASDGWSVDLHPLSWPNEVLFLSPPGQEMIWTPEGVEAQLWKLPPLASSMVAFGFSPTGKSLVVATSSDVQIFHRA